MRFKKWDSNFLDANYSASICCKSRHFLSSVLVEPNGWRRSSSFSCALSMTWQSGYSGRLAFTSVLAGKTDARPGRSCAKRFFWAVDCWITTLLCQSQCSQAPSKRTVSLNHLTFFRNVLLLACHFIWDLFWKSFGRVHVQMNACWFYVGLSPRTFLFFHCFAAFPLH